MKTINQAVNINAFYFPHGAINRALPRSIELNNGCVTFNDGLQYLIKQGERVIRLFDMSDGRQLYRLRFEPNSERWTLLSIKSL